MVQRLTEAMELRQRAAAQLPPQHAAADRFAEALLTVRACQDRIESLLGEMESLRHQARRWAWDHEAAAEDAFDAQVQLQRRAGRQGDDFRTGRERQAEINLLILPQLQTARGARRFSDEVDEIMERMRLLHRGLDGTRQDLGAYLRWLQWEKAMER
jgi:hypothetical protein